MKTIKSYNPSSKSAPYSFEGDIYKNDKIIRVGAAKHYRRIENTHQLKACLRAGEYAWPGGYQLFFYTSDGGILCYEAVLDNLVSVFDSIKTDCDDGWKIIGLGCTNELDGPVYCDHTGSEIS